MKSGMLAIAVSALALAPGVAGAEPPADGERYVALGSSYAAGPGLPPVVERGCGRSGQNYPHQVAAATGLELVDVTCSGATTADILQRPQRIPNRLLPPQIDAVTADTRLVTVSIGGNDLNLVGSMIAGSGCHAAVGAVPGLCDRALATTEPGRGAFEDVERSIAEVVTAVRERAPRATVALVQYLPVLPADGTPCAATPMSPEQAARARRTYDGLTVATRDAALATGARLIAVPEANAHTACSPEPWTFGFNNPLAAQGDPVSAVGSSYHPDAAGTTAVARQIIADLAD
ncbi:SGNH/GDSL hydrolase family protein [Nocardia mexicana]|uniref:Lysophospholipase L1-like esterase n=1 Tax=Nocardia mexicana TaxID=279262 RepID=A0A370HCT4_9NOCA|nr:SGNH/GDSL hydrolase family protein [Nocardia mexicana]RDI54590.1 lysophospholipase L1-like esterase [Nocardia mexicana]